MASGPTESAQLTLDDPSLELIANGVRRGECILFLGAGVHYPPPPGAPFHYEERHRPPLGAALSRRLARVIRLSEKYPREANNSENLQRVSWYFEKDLDRRQLVDDVRAAVVGETRASPVVSALAELPFRLIITTNYDQLFEGALTQAGKTPRIGVYQPQDGIPTPDVPDPTEKRPFLFKIHGDVDHRESLVITDEDYIQFVLRMGDKDVYHPVPETFRYYFKRWPTLFVGYSLVDYNLRLLFKTLRWKVDPANHPSTYSVDVEPDPLIMHVYQNQRHFVRFIVQDVWTFVPKLYALIMGRPMPPGGT